MGDYPVTAQPLSSRRDDWI